MNQTDLCPTETCFMATWKTNKQFFTKDVIIICSYYYCTMYLEIHSKEARNIL